MTKIIIFQLSLAMNNNEMRSVDAFIAAGINKWLMIWHWMPKTKFLERFLGKSISTLSDEYRTGMLTTAQFRDAVRAKFPNVHITDEQFDAAWNAMCVVSGKTIKALKELHDLAAVEGNIVYLVTNTNELHANHIKQQYGTELPGIPYFSFEKKKFGDPLLAQLHSELASTHPNLKPEEIKPENIGLFFMPAPQRNLGWFSWIRNYFPRFFQSNAENRVAELRRFARDKFTLLEFIPNLRNAIYSALTERGWLSNTQKVVLESSRSYTPGSDAASLAATASTSASSSVPANDPAAPTTSKLKQS